MDRQRFIDFNNQFSPANSGKGNSYAQAIKILDEVLRFQNTIDLHGKSLYNITEIEILEKVADFVKEEVKKMKDGQPNIFDFGKSTQKSYPRGGFCSAAISSLIDCILFDGAQQIVACQTDPLKMSKKLIKHFDITKEGEDVVSQTKSRRGQDYFRYMILTNYDSRCALTGIDMPELLLASHIIPWSDKKYKNQRLNPCNGICLSALYDKAFDKGLITFSPDDFSVIISSALRENESKEYYDHHFGCIIGRKLTMPIDYLPDRDFLAYHQENVFVGK